jgi:segregation and condensation protein A
VSEPALDFDAAQAAVEDGEALIVDLEAFEGPLDVLLALARRQKVDLMQISIGKLADQFLAFVREARRRRFQLAADYLVMAAWLAWLKSRLLIPHAFPEDRDEGTPEEEAGRLAFRLAKLDAMRRAAEALLARPMLGRDVFLRGAGEGDPAEGGRRSPGDLYELMQAYVAQRRRQSGRRYAPPPPQAWPLEAARARLEELLPELDRWTPLTGVAPMAGSGAGPSRASYIASTLSASLELVREGDLEARQLEAFAEIYVRARKAA